MTIFQLGLLAYVISNNMNFPFRNSGIMGVFSGLWVLALQVPPVKELRKVMRIHALRCHVIYCQNGTKLNVIPIMASRSQALR